MVAGGASRPGKGDEVSTSTAEPATAVTPAQPRTGATAAGGLSGARAATRRASSQIRPVVAK